MSVPRNVALMCRTERRTLIMHRGLTRTMAAITLAAISVVGCAAVENNPKTAIGAAGGATVGGLMAAAATSNPPVHGLMVK